MAEKPGSLTRSTPSVLPFLPGTLHPAWPHRPSPAVRQCELQLGLGEFQLLLPDGVGQHLPVGVVGVGLRAQLEELPDAHAQGPAEGVAIRGWRGCTDLRGSATTGPLL